MKFIYSSKHSKSPNNLGDKDTVVFSDTHSLVAIESGEISQSSFFESSNFWCFVVGKVFDSKNDNKKIKYPAKQIINDFQCNIEKFLLNVDGNFLIILFDKKSRCVSICRDLIGLYHAYYSESNGSIYLASSIKDVLISRKTQGTTLSDYGLELYLTFQYIPQPYTMFKDVFQVPVTGVLQYGNDTKIKKFDVSSFQLIRNHNSPIANSVLNILTSSMKRQLESKTRVGAFLSGGMDTSTNIGILTETVGVKPVVFTAGFAQAQYDESPYAKIMAKKYNLEHHIITIESNMFDEISTISSLYDNPIADRAIFPEYIICKLAKDLGITTMISGEGGDEVLGYPRNLPENVGFSLESKNNDELASYYHNLSNMLGKDLRDSIIKRGRHIEHQDYLAELYSSYG